jgi:PAS domain S-box-containing protein
MPTALRTLLLEDRQSDVELMLYELHRAGFEPEWWHANTEDSYVDLLSKDLDVILADYTLPQFDALHALQLLQERHLDIPFIVVTGSISEEAAVECMKLGASDYLLKDRLARLGPAVTQALEAKKLRDERRLAAEQIQQRNRELTLLLQIVAASAASLEPENVLETACRELALAFGVPHAAAFLLDDDGKIAAFVAEHVPPGWKRLIGTELAVAGNPLFRHILSRKSPLVANDGPNDPRLAPIRDTLIESNLSSMLIVPLTIENRVMGGVWLRSIEPYRFSVQQVALAWRVADQLSGAIARARLDKQHRLLTAAIEQAAESVIITDTEGTIVYVNPGFEQTTGYRRSEAIGENPRILKSGEQDATFYRDLWATLKAGRKWRGRVINKRKDGMLCTVDSSIAPVRDENGKVVNYVDVQRDVTHELELENRYLRAQKMEAVGRLASGIAHDFNNLLTAIKGYTGLLLNTLDQVASTGSPASPAVQAAGQNQLDLASIQEDLEEIDRATEHAAGLIRRLMAFGRKQVLQPQVLDLNDVVTNTEKMLRRLIGEDVDLVVNLAPDLDRIEADPGQMEQIIMNLAINARDAMPNGGQLVLETCNVSLDEPKRSTTPEVRPGAYVVMAVTDTGSGMDQEILSHLFEPFFTTKEVGKGTGLGLATVHRIVTQVGGGIDVRSKVGSGTTFRIYLPRAMLKTSLDTQAQPASSVPPGHETILVVEDEDFVRDLTARILRQNGYTVLTASRPDEALQTSAQHAGPIHLLVTDVVMPEMGGRDLAKRLTLGHPETKVLYVSGYTDDAVVQHGILDEDLAFLQKPYTVASLSDKVRSVLDTPPLNRR